MNYNITVAEKFNSLFNLFIYPFYSFTSICIKIAIYVVINSIIMCIENSPVRIESSRVGRIYVVLWNCVENAIDNDG